MTTSMTTMTTMMTPPTTMTMMMMTTTAVDAEQTIERSEIPPTAGQR